MENCWQFVFQGRYIAVITRTEWPANHLRIFLFLLRSTRDLAEALPSAAHWTLKEGPRPLQNPSEPQQSKSYAVKRISYLLEQMWFLGKLEAFQRSSYAWRIWEAVILALRWKSLLKFTKLIADGPFNCCVMSRKTARFLDARVIRLPLVSPLCQPFPDVSFLHLESAIDSSVEVILGNVAGDIVLQAFTCHNSTPQTNNSLGENPNQQKAACKHQDCPMKI